MSKPSFFSELKRRNVLRAGAFYAGGAWALAQGLAQLFPAFGVPDWVVRWIVIAAVIGFPFMLVFAWFYEFTTEGLKRESDITVEDEAGVRHSSKKMDRMIIAVLALAVVLLLTNQFVVHHDTGGDAAAGIPAKSVAVLPFENLSADASNKYFVSGMQDMILTKLADVADLKVISRTSTEKYASRPDDLKKVADELGVATVLEGSVQKAGNQVLINVQLINTATDAHVWASSYTKSLDNVFTVEGEVAQQVADALKAKLTPDEAARLVNPPSKNPHANDLYFQGAYYQRLALASYQDADYAKSIDYFRQATQVDPQFAMAYAQLALTEAYRSHFIGTSQPGWLEEAGSWVDQALKLAPDLAEAHLAQGYYRYYGQHDLKGALQAFEKAKTLKQDAAVFLGLGTIQKHLGNVKDAAEAYHHGAELDPRNMVVLNELAVVQQMQRNYGKAQKVLRHALTVEPTSINVLFGLSMSYVLSSGDVGEAAKVLDEAPASVQTNSALIAQRATLAFYGHDYAKARALWSQVKPGWVTEDGIESGLGDVEWAAGNMAAARQHYAKAAASMQKDIDNAPDLERFNGLDLALNYARMGDADKAMAFVSRIPSEHPLSGDVPDALDAWKRAAQIEAALGHADAAVADLDKLFQAPSGYVISVPLLKIDPSWDPIRKDPGFQALLTKYATVAPATSGTAAAAGG